MALRASQTRIIEKKYLIRFVLVGTMVHYGIMLYFVWIHKKGQLFEKCINIIETFETETQSLWGRYVILSAIALTITVSGLFCDVKTLLFVVKKLEFCSKLECLSKAGLFCQSIEFSVAKLFFVRTLNLSIQ